MILDRDSYTQGVDAICALFERSFGIPVSAEFLRWRYLDNPVGDVLANVELRAEGGFAANYSASPVAMRLGGEDAATALSMTTMTDPAYAGRGLFTTLAADLYRKMTERSYRMVWGFPNRNSHYAFVHRLGWRDVYEIPTMTADLSSVRVESPSATSLTDDRFELDYLAIPDPAPNFVVKTTAYLRWRYSAHPENHYTNIVLTDSSESVSAFSVVKQYGKALDIVDFQAPDLDQATELLGHVINHGRSNGLAAANCWAPRHHFIHGLYERAGFANSAPVTYLGFRELSSNRRRVSADYEQWFLQMGDSDVY